MEVKKTERNFAVRRMRAEDLPSVCALEKACFHDPWSENTLKSILESRLDCLWVLEETSAADGTDRIVGYLNYREIAGEGELNRVCVTPENRGLGLGEKLLLSMLDQAKENGVTDLTLEVRAGNAPAIGLYEKYGFRTEGVRKNYYTHPTEDALIMWKRG